MTCFRTFLMFLLLASTLALGGQPGNPAQADTASLQAQYDAMLKASNRFQSFKVVRQDFLNAFMSNITDSISVYTDEIAQLKETIANQSNKVEEQLAAISERDDRIGSLTGEKDSISLLGLQLSKTTYNVIMWSAILLLLAALLFAIGRMRLAVSNSREARLANEKISAELESSRKSRLKVEQDLRRQLQDERNKRLG